MKAFRQRTQQNDGRFLRVLSTLIIPPGVLEPRGIHVFDARGRDDKRTEY